MIKVDNDGKPTRVSATLSKGLSDRTGNVGLSSAYL